MHVDTQKEGSSDEDPEVKSSLRTRKDRPRRKSRGKKFEKGKEWRFRGRGGL